MQCDRLSKIALTLVVIVFCVYAVQRTLASRPAPIEESWELQCRLEWEELK